MAAVQKERLFGEVRRADALIASLALHLFRQALELFDEHTSLVACQGDDALFDVRLGHVPTLDAYLEFRRGFELIDTDKARARARLSTPADLSEPWPRAGGLPFVDAVLGLV